MKMLAIGFAILVLPAMVSAHESVPKVVADTTVQLMAKGAADEATAQAWALKNVPQDLGNNGTLADCATTVPASWTAETTAGCTNMASSLLLRERRSSGKPRLALETLVQMVLFRTMIASSLADPDDSDYLEKAGAQNMARLRMLDRDAKRMNVGQISRYTSPMLS